MGGVSDDVPCELGDDESQIMWYFAMRACEAFSEAHGRMPGAECGHDAASLQAEVDLLAPFAEALLKDLDATLDTKLLHELVRSGGSKLHTTAAVLGGVAAQ